MKKKFIRAAFAAALLCGAAGAVATLTSGPALAAEEKVSRAVAKPLVEAQKALEAKDYKTALDKVHEAQAASDKTPFDEYKINNFIGIIAYNTKDYATAATAFEAMADSPAMPDEETKPTLHNAMGLASNQQHWPKVIAYGRRLDALSDMDDTTYAQLAIAYYETKDLTNARTFAQKSIDAAKAAGKAPDQNILIIVMNAQANGNNQAGALQTREQLAVTYGDPDSWDQLIGLAMDTKGVTETDALFLSRLRFLSGAKSSAEEYSFAAGLALHAGYPAEANDILEKGFANGLSRKGQVAAEYAKARSDARVDEAQLKSIAAAAEKANTGEQDVKMAEDYWGYSRYADAAAAAARGIAKGHTKTPGEGEFIHGISLVAQGKYAEGREALAKVDGSEARTKAAHLWDLYAQFKTKQAAATAAPAPAH